MHNIKLPKFGQLESFIKSSLCESAVKIYCFAQNTQGLNHRCFYKIKKKILSNVNPNFIRTICHYKREYNLYVQYIYIVRAFILY